jgi:hypothetical protein
MILSRSYKENLSFREAWIESCGPAEAGTNYALRAWFGDHQDSIDPLVLSHRDLSNPDAE